MWRWRVNRKNPGLAEEPKPISKEEERSFYLYAALSWSLAASLYTIYAFWKGNPHTQETALLGWFLATWSWGYWLYERRKANRHRLSKP